MPRRKGCNTNKLKAMHDKHPNRSKVVMEEEAEEAVNKRMAKKEKLFAMAAKRWAAKNGNSCSEERFSDSDSDDVVIDKSDVSYIESSESDVDMNISAEDVDTNYVEVPLGNKNALVSGNALLNFARAIHNCPENGDPSCLTINERPKERQGHLRALKASCSACKLDVYLDENPHKSGTCFREHKLINRRFVFGADLIGVDRTDMEYLCSCLDIPGPSDGWDAIHQRDIRSALKETISEKLAANREEVHKNCQKTESGIALATVKTDGTYQKRGDLRRGYTSKIGVVLVTDADTDKVLDYRIMHKYCHMCVQKKAQLTSAEFDVWQSNHIDKKECGVNYDGASSEMERTAVLDMYKRSLEHHMMYVNLVGDADSKAFLDVWDVYGVCSHCERVRKILTKRGDSKELNDWMATDDYKEWVEVHEDINSGCYAVRKYDCGNHVGKAFRSKLEDLRKSNMRLSDGLGITNKNNQKYRLGQKTVINMQKNFNKAVRQHIRSSKSTDAEIQEASKNMKVAILAGLYHITLFDDPETRHQYCPLDSWCSYHVTGQEIALQQHYIKPCVHTVILPVYEYYCKLTPRMVLGYNTNKLECWNSTLWNHANKAKFHGAAKMDISVMITLLEFEDGKTGLLPVMEKLGIKPESEISCFQQHDQIRKRLRLSEAEQNLKRYETRKLEAIAGRGDGYAAGSCDAGAGPSAMMPSTPLSTTKPAKVHVNQFIVLPSIDNWYAAEIVEVDMLTKEIQVKFMYSSDGNKTFEFKREEELYWELISSVIYHFKCIPELTPHTAWAMAVGSTAVVCNISWMTNVKMLKRITNCGKTGNQQNTKGDLLKEASCCITAL